mgnify:CR=1 FL=1
MNYCLFCQKVLSPDERQVAAIVLNANKTFTVTIKCVFCRRPTASCYVAAARLPPVVDAAIAESSNYEPTMVKTWACEQIRGK